MRLERLTINMFSAVADVFCCALLAFPLVAQEKVDLVKITAQLKDKDAAVRRSAIEALSQSNDPAGINLLISALDDDNQDVRSAAALALGQTGATKGVEPLTKMLQSVHLRDRRSAIIALGTIGGDKACDALIPLLKSLLAEDRDSVIAALGSARCARAIARPAREAMTKASSLLLV
jgi:HEAT repeat protein